MYLWYYFTIVIIASKLPKPFVFKTCIELSNYDNFAEVVLDGALKSSIDLILSIDLISSISLIVVLFEMSKNYDFMKLLKWGSILY